MNINKTIHEAMGFKWTDEDKSVWNCKCDCIVPTYPTFRLNKHVAPCEHAEPDYTDPVHYCALMDWIYADIGRIVCIGDFATSSSVNNLRVWFAMTRQEQITLIAEAIEAGVLK